MKKLLVKVAPLFASLALLVGIATANAPCFILYHQPKMPAAMDKFVK